jgi:prepilin-type N-terminal cleavage/methylation domain-containing protein
MKRHEEAGFTMVEVMVAVLLSAIAVMGIVGLFKVQSNASSFSRHNTEASVLASDKMEFLRTQGVPVAGSESGLDALGNVGVGGLFDRSWTVTGTTIIDYSVTVGWDEDGVARSVMLQSKRGL